MSQLSSTADSSSYGAYDNYIVAEVEPDESGINAIRTIAKKMKSAGYLSDCLEVYKSSRKPLVDKSFKLLGIKKLSPGDIRRILAEELIMKIELWIRAANQFVPILYMEKKVGKIIFEGLGDDEFEECFIEIVKDVVIQLLDFPKDVSATRRSPKILLTILDLYNSLSKLLPDMKVLFQLKSIKGIEIDYILILDRLAEMVRGILSDFEHDVVHEISTRLDDISVVHPFTLYVMNFLHQIMSYNYILTHLITSKLPTRFGDLKIPDVELVQHDARTPLEHHLVFIIIALRFKLEEKSKYYYKDVCMAHLFTIKNLNFVVERIHASPQLHATIGRVYMTKLCEYVWHAIVRYQDSTCDKLLSCLRFEGPVYGSMCFSYVASKRELRKRIQSFNSMFEELHSIQISQNILDFRLREELNISLSEKVSPAYECFLKRFNSHVKTSIKYSVNDIEKLIRNRFF